MRHKDALAASSRGRPSLAQSRAISDRILLSASRLFEAQGYTGTSMDAVAVDAGVHKQAIYKRYPSKDALFVETYNNRIASITISVAESADPQHTPAETLKMACRAMTISMLDPSMVNLCRIAIAESARFPHLSAMVREGSIREFVVPLTDPVRALQRSGDLPPGDPELLSHTILVACYTFPFLEALLGHNPLADLAERQAYFERVWPLVTMGRLA